MPPSATGDALGDVLGDDVFDDEEDEDEDDDDDDDDCFADEDDVFGDDDDDDAVLVDGFRALVCFFGAAKGSSCLTACNDEGDIDMN